MRTEAYHLSRRDLEYAPALSCTFEDRISECPANSSCRSVSAVALIWAITRCARRPSSTILQRRSCDELLRVIQSSRSSRCNNVTTLGSSTPSRAAISAWVSASPAIDKCISVRHFAWLSPIGLSRCVQFLPPCTRRAVEQLAQIFSGVATGHNYSRSN